MIYKSESDGLQVDALCWKLYTYQILMHNDPVPKTYLSQSLSPLHAIMMSLFGAVKGKRHQCAMDYLYNSGTFFKTT